MQRKSGKHWYASFVLLVEPDQLFAAEVERIRQAYSRRTDPAKYSGPAHRLAIEELSQRLRSTLANRGYASLADARILEIGCGTGAWLRQFVDWGASPENICGVDLLSERIEKAKILCPAGIKLSCQNAARLPQPNGAFDLVLQSTVFTSILDPAMKQQVADEILRVLSPQGLILWYDFCLDNPRNPDVRGVPRSEISQHFPGCEIRLEKITLAPPLGRQVARFSRSLYKALSRAEILCTHYLGTISRRRETTVSLPPETQIPRR
jgi:ubiquinone/menaquinone biosynthesis C-methylase UbiE